MHPHLQTEETSILGTLTVVTQLDNMQKFLGENFAQLHLKNNELSILVEELSTAGLDRIDFLFSEVFSTLNDNIEQIKTVLPVYSQAAYVS